MSYTSTFWRKQVFTLVMIGSILFVLLTLAAMWFFPGGTLTDHNTTGYSFFKNFFSELGFLRSHAGQPNTISAVLFFTALSLAGAGLILFFLAFPQFFNGTRSGQVLSIGGSLFGVISGLFFIGVAFTPADLFLEAHKIFVMWAFRLFPVAIFLYSVAIFRERSYPDRYAFVFVLFGFLLVFYIFLLELGPKFDTPQGMVVQAIGQKIIVYASILSILVQAWEARKLRVGG